MKAHTSGFKDNVKLFGRELDSKITYTIDNEEITLTSEELNSVTPHYEGDILKSVMKELDIDSNVDIPLETELNYQFGVKVNDSYEYIDYGNYIVYSSEKQEDLDSYKIKCYDKMLYAMKDYDEVATIYPLTVREYIQELCETIGLTFKNVNDTFPNYNRTISSDLYKGLGYTYRDVLDELAQVTASTICINEEDDELEIRYITDTNDTIDEEYLKDVNVNFGKKYGPVNSIVLSRGAESDNVYLQDQQSIEQNGLCEIKIKDNQIMNFNDRSDYLPDILGKLGGLEYYLNDFSSTGTCYYELCDRYNISINNEIYSCVMFNDEMLVTQGLEENIHTDMPEETETDYTKADKTDRKINQTYLIVDKQNQTIESVVSNVDEQDQKIAQITQTVEELNSKISDIADITQSQETNSAVLSFESVNESEPIRIVVRPISESISYLYPTTSLHPSSTTYLKNRAIRFYNETTEETTDYTLPDDLLFYNSENYDEFILDYDGQSCVINKKCKYNADGSVGLLTNPVTNSYTYPYIPLKDGDYTITLLGYDNAYLFVRVMSQNIYTTQFATKSELNSAITQTAGSINASVDQKLSNYSTTTEMNAAITLKANEINSVVSTKVGNNEVISKINQSSEAITINANKISLNGKTIDLTGDNIAISSTNFNVDSNGNMTATSGTFNGTLNTSQNCTIGNDLYVGQNQSSSGVDQKYIKFSNDTYFARYYNTSSNWDTLGIDSQYVGITGVNGFGLATGEDGHTTKIWASDQPYGEGEFLELMSSPIGQYFNITESNIHASKNLTIDSDKRLKDKIKDIDTSFIDDLKVKEFEYKRTPGKKQIGLIAQDYVGKDYSEYFLEKNKDEYYGINYGNITNALIQYCQDLKKEVNELKQEISKMKGDK